MMKYHIHYLCSFCIKKQQQLTITILFFILILNNIDSVTTNSSESTQNSTGTTVKKQLDKMLEFSEGSVAVKANNDHLIIPPDAILNSSEPHVNSKTNNSKIPINISSVASELNNNKVNTTSSSSTTSPLPTNNNNNISKHSEKSDDIPNSIKVGFYIIIGLGVVAVLFFTYKSYRLRLSKAERRYGVQGDRRAQELTPLPIAIDDDSENEDHTLFDINSTKQIRIS